MATHEIVDSNTGEVYSEPTHPRRTRMNAKGSEVVSCVTKTSPKTTRTMRDTMEEMMRQMFLAQVSKGEEYETFEEANDFDVDDDEDDYVSQYEMEEEFDPMGDMPINSQNGKEDPAPGADTVPTEEAEKAPANTSDGT